MDVSKTGMPLPGQIPAGEKPQKVDHGSGQASDGVNFESILSGEIHAGPCDALGKGKCVSPSSGPVAGHTPERDLVTPAISAPEIEEIFRPAEAEMSRMGRRETIPAIDGETMAILEKCFGEMLVEREVPGIPDFEPAEGVSAVDESPGRRLLEGFVRLKMDIDGFRPGGPEDPPETGPDEEGKSGDFATRAHEAGVLVFGDIPQRSISNLDGETSAPSIASEPISFATKTKETSAPSIASEPISFETKTKETSAPSIASEPISFETKIGETSAPSIARIFHETPPGSKPEPGYADKKVEMTEVRKVSMKTEQSGISLQDVELKTAARNAYLGTRINTPAENFEEGFPRGNVSRPVLPSGVGSTQVVDKTTATLTKTGVDPVPGNSEKTPGVLKGLEGFREMDSFEARHLTRAKEDDPLRSEAVEFAVPVAGSRDPLGQVERFSPAVVGESLARFVEVIRDRKGHRGTLELDPPELGRLRITLESTRDSLNLHLVVEKAHSRSMIEESLGALRDSLARQGISLGETTVDVGGHAPQGRGSSPWVPGEQGGIPLTGAADAEDVTEQEQVVARLDIERGLFHWIA
ncbi:MAG TPA: flagellar hook-length control protein FliK [Thermovirgaceae bacterium]|nr:flagellar hook-length control protein FliK [Thermovirgaceae bacterium]